MKKQLSVYRYSDGLAFNEDIELPSFCPRCGVHLSPEVIYAYMIDYEDEEDNKAFLLNFCPECDQCFISKHIFDSKEGSGYRFESSAPVVPHKNTFSSNIATLSPDFVKIYNESLAAEEMGFSSICGMGYRKSLEFLIKDFLICQNPSLKETISQKTLGACIKEYISDDRLQSLAKASAWLGNDETHYVKKHNDYNVVNLKSFINAFVTFIDAELAYQEAKKLISKS